MARDVGRGHTHTSPQSPETKALRGREPIKLGRGFLVSAAMAHQGPAVSSSLEALALASRWAKPRSALQLRREQSSPRSPVVGDPRSQLAARSTVFRVGVFGSAEQFILPQSATQKAITPISIILHTVVGDLSLEDTRQFWKSNKEGKEAHFAMEVGGRLGQFMDTHVDADNNFRANSFIYNGSMERLRGKRCGAISIETGDKFNAGDPGLVKSWTDLGQRRPLEDLLVELCRTENIPAVKCSGPFEAGIGYHAMWGFNEFGSGDGKYGHITDTKGRNIRLNNPWTNTVGKICPGPGPGVAGGKIGEFDDLLAAVRRRLSSGVTSHDAKKQEDNQDMAVWLQDETGTRWRSQGGFVDQVSDSDFAAADNFSKFFNGSPIDTIDVKSSEVGAWGITLDRLAAAVAEQLRP